jgi:immunity protein 17 of polymorphic toxin system
MNYLYFLLLIVIGLYSIAGAALNWEWFMGDSKAKVFARLFGRTGTRVFYIFLGVGFVIIGFLGVFGVLG